MLFCLASSIGRADETGHILDLVRPILNEDAHSSSGQSESVSKRDNVLRLAGFIANLKTSSVQPNHRIALVTFLVAGGQASIVRRALTRNGISIQEESYIEGLLLFAEGHVEAARDRLDQIDVFRLPVSIAGQVAYIRALARGSACSDRLGDDLKRVALLSPGFMMSRRLATKILTGCSTYSDLEVKELLFRQLFGSLGTDSIGAVEVSSAFPELDSFLVGVLSESESARTLFVKLPNQVKSSTARSIGRRALLSPSEARSQLLDFMINAISDDPKLQNILRVYRYACCFMISQDAYGVSDKIRIDELDFDYRAIFEAAKKLRRLVESQPQMPQVK